MTDIRDLYSDPKERLDHIFTDFVRRLEETHTYEESRLDRTYELCRARIEKQHKKIVSSYKGLYQTMLEMLQHDKDVYIVQMFEAFLKGREPALFSEVFERALPVIRDIEENGGRLAVNIQKEGYGSGGCIYRPGRNDYFSFFEEAIGEPDAVYKVVRRYPSREELAVEEEERLRRMMARHGMTGPPANETILRDYVDCSGSSPDI